MNVRLCRGQLTVDPVTQCLERYPVATGLAEFGLAYVFKDATVVLDGPRRGGIGVVAGDEYTFQSKRACFG